MSTIRLGDKAPNFKAQTSEGEIDFYEYLGDGWEYCFLTLQITPRYVLPNWVLRQNTRMNLTSEMLKFLH